MNSNATFRRQPLNYNNHPRTVGPTNRGTLIGVRPTPPQFGINNNVVSLHEFRRAPATFLRGKWKQPGSSSDVIASKKRNAIGTGAYYSSNGIFSTKRQNVNDVQHVLKKLRSS
jgi:hypothetical protein